MEPIVQRRRSRESLGSAARGVLGGSGAPAPLDSLAASKVPGLPPLPSPAAGAAGSARRLHPVPPLDSVSPLMGSSRPSPATTGRGLLRRRTTGSDAATPSGFSLVPAARDSP